MRFTFYLFLKVVGGHRIDDELVKQIITSQSRRLDDQRTPLPTDNQEETFLNLVSQIQGARMDDQRASLHLDPIEKDPDADQVGESAQNGYMDDDEFIELLYRCQVREDEDFGVSVKEFLMN